MIGVAEIYELAERAGDLHRCLVLLGGFGSVRIGELLRLVRSDWNPQTRELKIERQRLLYKAKGEAKATMHIGTTKSDAGVRTIVIPDSVADELTQHIDDNVARDPGAVLFVGKRSRRPLHHGSWNDTWLRITRQAREAGVEIPEGFVFHDLRHTGNTLAAKTPHVTVADLQERLGDANAGDGALLPPRHRGNSHPAGRRYRRCHRRSRRRGPPLERRQDRQEAGVAAPAGAPLACPQRAPNVPRGRVTTG